jgi:hypothetical protein
MVAVVEPVFHKYVPPPDAVNVALNPLHIVCGAPALAVGGAFTFTDVVAVAVQPLVPVTVTV